jgi:hypothetical protein
MKNGTTENLKTLAEMALSNARRQLEATRRLNPKVAFEVNGRVKWMPDFPGEILDDGPMKELFFGGLRQVAQQLRATAVILVTDAWSGAPTEKRERLERDNPEELQRLASELHSLSDWEAAGLARRVEAISVLVQTADEIHLLEQQYERVGDRIVWNDRRTMTGKQSDYQGRTKMYGG